MKDKNIKSVPTQLIQQNCYIRDVTRCSETTSDIPKQYISLDEITTDNGIQIVETIHDYPITPSSVNSYYEGTNYKNDPQQAIAQAPQRVNLGDITELQKVDSMDMESAMALYQKLRTKIESATKQSVVKNDTNETKQKQEVTI